ncbi:thioesterase family protein [Beijerinckia sp. L45]|uniref:acyl-CoA thioesterase n=1 Tax=Beijerinckia sp. L45 TaxID=1641855 RepID=UPI001AED9064|nr:thioesterase family protein [Beijerinckia sp. L45]
MTAVSDTPPARAKPLPLADLPAAAWRQDVRIRFSHCDPAGIVYFARYFDILHGVVEDWFEDALGLSHATLIKQHRIGLGYAHAEADFFAPGFHGDVLTVIPLIARIGGSSIGLRLHAYRGDTPVLAANLVIATTSLDAHRSISVPDDVRAALTAYHAVVV